MYILFGSFQFENSDLFQSDFIQLWNLVGLFPVELMATILFEKVV